MTEVQKNIVEKEDGSVFVSENEFFDILKLVAPGTNLRSALNGALQAGKGALVVVENDNTPEIFEGGFEIGSRFTPQRIVELSKMDGAIILSKDLKKISYANVLLTPSSKFKTVETGTRHKAAERVAQQAGTLVLAISERKSQMTLYYKGVRYPLANTSELLRKANEYIQLLEKQRKLFDDSIERLTRSELKTYFDLKLAIQAIQKGKLIQKVARDLEKYSIELGGEATLIKIGLKELSTGVKKETDSIIRDYTNLSFEKSQDFLDGLTYNDLLAEEVLADSLGHESSNSSGDSISGWRILSKTLLSNEEIENFFEKGNNLKNLLNYSEEEFLNIFGEGIGIDLKKQIDNIKVRF